MRTLFLFALFCYLCGNLDAAGPATAGSRKDGVYDIRDHGAVGDGKTLNTEAIQLAIDACHADGGGRVMVQGGVFLTGGIQLRSNVVLHVAAGTTLLGSGRIRDYGRAIQTLDWHERLDISFPGQCLIYAEDAENVAIEGHGVIDGQGGKKRRMFPNRDDPRFRRPMLVRFQNCRRISLRDIMLRDPACFATFFVHSRDILIDGVTIRSRSTNSGDGLDFDGSQNVRIANCDLDCGDDAISPKTFHPDWPNRNFTITNCRLSSEWAAVRIGPESRADMRQFAISNCVFENCRDGFKIQSCEGAMMEDMVFSNIVMRDVNRPMFITLNRFSMSRHEISCRPPVKGLRNLLFTNIRAVARQGAAADPFDQPCLAVVGLPGHFVENVTFANMSLTFPGGGTAEQAAGIDVKELFDFNTLWPEAMHSGGVLPCSNMYLRHVRGIRLNNVRMAVAKPDARPFIAGDDLEEVDLGDIVGTASGRVPGLAKLANARQVRVRDCRVSADAGSETPILLPLNSEEQRRLADHRQRAAELDAEMQREADLVDTAERKTKRLLVLPLEWSFRADPQNEGQKARWFADGPGKQWTKLRINRSWTQQGFPTLHGSGWYATQFTTPGLESTQHVYLYFGAIRGTCRVWVDAKPAGRVSIASVYTERLPLVLDVTSLIAPSSQHCVVAQVAEDSGDAGLCRPVELRIAK